MMLTSTPVLAPRFQRSGLRGDGLPAGGAEARPALQRLDGDPGAVLAVPLEHHAGEVTLDGGDVEAHGRGNLRVGLALDDQGHDLALAVGQRSPVDGAPPAVASKSKPPLSMTGIGGLRGPTRADLGASPARRMERLAQSMSPSRHEMWANLVYLMPSGAGVPSHCIGCHHSRGRLSTTTSPNVAANHKNMRLGVLDAQLPDTRAVSQLHTRSLTPLEADFSANRSPRPGG